MKTLKHLFENNLGWATSITEKDPEFFARLSGQQTPEYLWIGCSDSRVSANMITGLQPGDMFVHRNIANLVVHTDLNCLSVIQFAVEILKVKHIIVCGHYGCGGIKAALENYEHGVIGNWLRHIKDVIRFNQSRFDDLEHEQQLNLLCELNVTEQVTNICNTAIVKNTWEQGRELSVHGWIYDINNGILKDLDESTSSLPPKIHL